MRNFRDKYERERQADFLAGEILEISDDGTKDFIRVPGAVDDCAVRTHGPSIRPREDRSYCNEESARIYNPELDLALWVNEPSAGKERYVLVHCEHGTLGAVETDDELRELVASFCRPSFNMLQEGSGMGACLCWAIDSDKTLTEKTY